MPPPLAVVVNHVDAAYSNSPAVLHDLSLTIHTGEHVAIIGRSGCGKSTLLHLIGGLLTPTHGEVDVLGGSGSHGSRRARSTRGNTESSARLHHCALISQQDSLLPWFTVQDNVAIPLRNSGVRRRDARTQAQHMLTRCGLANTATAYPAELSGGMRQRVALARALLANKPLLLADEPLGALDAITRSEIQDWLTELLLSSSPGSPGSPGSELPGPARNPPPTMIMVTHDVDEALLLSHRVILLANGQIAGEWPGWFARRQKDAHAGEKGYERETILANPEFTEQRTDILRTLRHTSVGVTS